MDNLSSYIYDKYLAKHLNQNVCLKVAHLGNWGGFFRSRGCHVIKPIEEKTLWKSFWRDSNIFHTLVDVVYQCKYSDVHASCCSNKNLFRNMANSLKQGGLFCIEADKRSFTGIGPITRGVPILKEWAKDNHLNVLEIKMVKENLLIMIAQKSHEVDFSHSKNFWRYKKSAVGGGLPQMKPERIEKQYKDLKTFHNLCEKLEIKYSAIGGSALGLVRHGGIIPWDNDIDVAMSPHHWNKLFKFRKKFINHGLWHNRESKDKNQHCHFGSIDVFKVEWTSASSPNFYKGVLGAWIHKEEWANLKKQIFGGQYIYAPVDCSRLLTARYGKHYYDTANLSDCWHNRHLNVKNFNLCAEDRRYKRNNYINNFHDKS